MRLARSSSVRVVCFAGILGLYHTSDISDLPSQPPKNLIIEVTSLGVSSNASVTVRL
jgi:hypothetical protein